MNTLNTNVFLHAKTTLALAACMLLGFSLTIRADDYGTSSSGSSSTKNKGGLSSSSSTQSGTSSQLSSSDQKFIKHAAKGGMMEVQMGQLGIQKAQSQAVKQFAQRLIDDHTKANAELKQLAANKGITLPDSSIASSSTSKSERTRVREETPGTAAHKEHAAWKKLQTLSGTDFDREFVRLAVNDHEKDIKEFEKEAQKADDADVKAFAQKTAPTLREHLQQARNLESQVGAPGSSSGTGSGGSKY